MDSDIAGGGGDPSPPIPIDRTPRRNSPVTRLAVKIRLHTDTKERAGYWAAKAGLSANEYMAEAVEEKIARESGDYDVPSFMDKRFSQIIDELKALSTNVASLEVVTVAGNDTIMNLTRGDSYLLDDDDGELVSAP